VPDTDDSTTQLIAQADALLKKAQEHLSRTEQVFAERGLTREQAMELIESRLTPAERADLQAFVAADRRDYENKRAEALMHLRSESVPAPRPGRKFRAMV